MPQLATKSASPPDDPREDGLVQYHKNRSYTSINPSHKDAVRDVLRGGIPDYILNLH